jgi:tRNA1(Val) A37 N6-methylase TrmN6
MEITEDTLLGGRVRLRQPAEGYRAAIDPVFLAAAVPAQPGQMVLDVGIGVGAAALCLAARVPGCRIFGIEVQPALAALARENVQINGFAGQVDVLTGTLAAPPPRLAPGSFHHVMSNPPFQAEGSGSASPDPSKHTANAETDIPLDQWLRFCVNMLRPKGVLTLVHRTDRIDELLYALRGRVGEITLLPLWPKAGRPAKRILLRARKGINAPLELQPGMILHEADGNYTVEAKSVLWAGAPIG